MFFFLRFRWNDDDDWLNKIKDNRITSHEINSPDSVGAAWSPVSAYLYVKHGFSSLQTCQVSECFGSFRGALLFPFYPPVLVAHIPERNTMTVSLTCKYLWQFHTVQTFRIRLFSHVIYEKLHKQVHVRRLALSCAINAFGRGAKRNGSPTSTKCQDFSRVNCKNPWDLLCCRVCNETYKERRVP